MRCHHDLRTQVARPRNGAIEVVRLELQQRAVAVGLGGIADRPMVVLNPPVVQLKDQLPVPHEALVLGTAVRAVAVEEPLIPAAAGLDVGNRDEGLRTHLRFPSRAPSRRGAGDAAGDDHSSVVALLGPSPS
jgi:hypothetical protein